MQIAEAARSSGTAAGRRCKSGAGRGPGQFVNLEVTHRAAAAGSYRLARVAVPGETNAERGGTALSVRRPTAGPDRSGEHPSGARVGLRGPGGERPDVEQQGVGPRRRWR